MKKTVLITGGFGYLGRYLVNYLLKKNFQVIVIDNLINGVKFKRKKLIFYKLNYASKKLINIIKKHKIDNIIHLAAFIDSEESMQSPKKYFKNNVDNLINFLINLKNLKIKKFVFASSAAVYGSVSKSKINENFKTQPESIYGLTKLQGEKVVQFYSLKYQFQSSILRFFNLVGCDYKIKCGPLNKSYKHIFNTLLKSNDFTINGTNYDTFDGTCQRDYINIIDISKIILKILNQNFKENLLLNCGSGIGKSVREISFNFKKKINSNLKIKEGPRRDGDPASIVANISKIKKILKFKPKYSSLSIIMKQYSSWFKNTYKNKK